MKKFVVFVTAVICLLFATLGVSASSNVDNEKYIPKVITTDNGYKMIFDSELARIARRMASDSYGIAIDSNVQDISKTFQAEDFEDIRQSHLFDEPFMGAFSNNFLVGVKTFEVDGVQKHVLAIAFRGTQVKDGFDYADLFTDASVLGLNGFHSGFYAAALKAYDTLYDIEFPSLKNEDGSSMTFSDYLAHSGVVGSDYSILVTGHSLGGAVANIFAGDIISQFGKSNVMCYTFASPIVCSPTKAKEYDAYNIFNIINTNDIVPNVGYNLFAGVRLGTDLKVSVTDSEESAHSLSVTYEKATNQVINKMDSLYPYIHRVCNDTTDEIHIHTNCSLEKRRFPSYLQIDTLKVEGNINVNNRLNIKGTLAHDLFSNSKLTINEEMDVSGNWEIGPSGSAEINSDVLVGENLYQGGELVIKKAKLEVVGNCVIGNWNPSKKVYMEDEESLLLVHGDYWHLKNSSSENLTDGTIEIKGDMIECGGYRPSGTHKTVLSGNTLQNINMLGSQQYGHFNILELKNTSVDGIDFTATAYVDKEISSNGNKVSNGKNIHLCNDAKVREYSLVSDITLANWNGTCSVFFDGDVYLKGNNVFNNPIKIGGTIAHDLFSNSKLTINEEMEAAGNWEIGPSGSAEINSDVLVGENLYQGGELVIKKAKLEVVGNCVIGNWNPSKKVYMEDEESLLLVHGDYWHLKNSSSENLTAGTIEIKGDMIECGGYKPSGTHKTVLSGNTLQNINMLGSQQYGHFNILELKNTSVDGIDFTATAYVDKEISSNGNKVSNGKNIHLCNDAKVREYSLVSDITLANWNGTCSVFFDGDVYLKGNNVFNNPIKIGGTIAHDLFSNSKLTINEEMEAAGNWEIGPSGSAEINSDVLVGENLYQGGELVIKKAKLEVVGNCVIGNWNPSKKVYMEDEESLLLVHGDYWHLKNSSSENLTAGTIEIKGDMIECGGYRPSGTHKTVLSGNTLQNINMLGNQQYGHFNVLELKNTSVDGISFDIKANVHADIIQPIGTKLVDDNYITLQNRPAFVDYGELNSQINAYNGNEEKVIPTWLDYERYCKFALDGDNAFILNDSITDTTFTCDLYFSNDYSKTSAVVIVAFYDGDNRFVQMASKPVDVKEGKIDVSIDYENKPYSKYKIMVWENFDNIKPLMKVK